VGSVVYRQGKRNGHSLEKKKNGKQNRRPHEKLRHLRGCWKKITLTTRKKEAQKEGKASEKKKKGPLSPCSKKKAPTRVKKKKE